MNATYQTLSLAEDFGHTKAGEGLLFLCGCGYESRALHLCLRLRGMRQDFDVLALGFPEYGEILCAPANRRLVRELGHEVTPTDGSVHGMLSLVDTAIDRILAKGLQCRILVDYSSMPRRWYCNLLRRLQAAPKNVHSEFWYVQGRFPGGIEYPCVGFGDFTVFSGVPRVTRTTEIHIFGLGLDSTRTYGIWNLLDPQFTCCLIAASDANTELVQRVHKLNEEILLSANIVENVCFGDFPRMLASIVDLARKCVGLGDVCLVADGPKPLVLAMSVAPDIVGIPGISSWHVSHVKPDSYEPIDVAPTEHAYGFSVISSGCD